MSAINFLLHEVQLDLRRGGIVRIAPVVIMAVTLFVLGIFLVVTVNLRKGISIAQGKVEMVVFLREDDSATVETVRAALQSIGGVREVRFVSRDDALERFREDLGEKRELLEAVESNPLPSSFELAIFDDFKSPDKLARIASEVGALPAVEGSRYGQEWVGRLQRLIVFSVFLDLFLGVLLGVSTVLSVANTLRLALEERRESIDVMRLVGASEGMIRGPIFTEGAIIGVIAGGVASVSLYACYVLLAGRVPELAFMGPRLVALFILTGAALGGLGSLVALGRILRAPVSR